MSGEYTATRTYIGRRIAAGDVLAYAYITDDGEEVWLKKPIRSGLYVGQVLRLTYTDDTFTQYWSKGQNAPEVIGRTDVDDEILLQWQVADRAAYEAKSQAAAMTRAIRETSPLDKHIDALATAAASMTTIQRAAFARWVAERLR